MTRRSLIFIMTLLYGSISSAQIRTVNQSILFSDHLQKIKLYNECSLLLRQAKNNPEVTSMQKDTLSFNQGLVFYKRDILDSSVISFDNVSEASPLYNESRFCKSYILSEKEKYSESINPVSELNCSTDADIATRQLFYAGISLLMRDTSQFRSISESFPKASREIESARNDMSIINEKIKSFRRKSGFLAGTMSAIIPGAGKVYAGKIRQGISTFIPVVLMGAQAFEAGRKGGIKSLRFIFYSGLFSVFYIGNIWGSVLSVSVCHSEFNHEINNQILFDMRIPVQKLFR